MRDPYIVLKEKEQQATRVRKEIEALLLAIPLLIEEPQSWEEIRSRLLTSNLYPREDFRDGMDELKMYFPFVKDLSLDPGAAG